MKRVLFVDHVSRILGGAEVNLVELLATEQARQSWEVACACPPGSPLSAALERLDVRQFPHSYPPAASELRIVGQRLAPLAKLQGWLALRRAESQLSDIVGGFRPIAVISCANKDHFCAGHMCRRQRLPCIWWVNDVISADFFPWLVRRIFRWQAARLASRLVVVSDYARQALLREGVPPGLVTTIHNGIPMSRYARGPRGQWGASAGLSCDQPLIGLVGRFTPWKGQELFLQLARLWRQQGLAGTFALIGKAFNEDQAFEASLRRFVDEQGLRSRVVFVPFQENLAAALSDLDVLLHTSLKPEPFGRVLIEAMAVGVPVIAARSGGVPEIITHGADGLLVDPGRLEAYAEALGGLLRSPALAQQLGRAGRRTVEQRFTVERVQAQFEGLLADC